MCSGTSRDTPESDRRRRKEYERQKEAEERQKDFDRLAEERRAIAAAQQAQAAALSEQMAAQQQAQRTKANALRSELTGRQQQTQAAIQQSQTAVRNLNIKNQAVASSLNILAKDGGKQGPTASQSKRPQRGRGAKTTSTGLRLGSQASSSGANLST